MATNLTINSKAWFGGVGILAVAYGVWLVAVRIGETEIGAFRLGEFHSVYFALMLFLWLSPVVSALVVSYFSLRKKILLGMSMTLVAAVLAVAVNGVSQLLGDAVDFSGLKGAIILFTVTTVYSGIGSAIGSLCGYWLSRKIGVTSKDVR